MKFLSKLKRITSKPAVLGVVAAAALGAAVFVGTSASQAAGGGDCDSNAVIRCGVGSVSDAKNSYNSDASVRKIYSCMGISRSEVENMQSGLDNSGSGVTEGTVTSSGSVYVNGKLVASGAKTGGRQDMPGSTDRTQACGTPFFERSPSVSFQQPSLEALVDMQNGQFQFAIINSCGNPVVATATTKPTHPNYQIEKLVSVKGQDNFKKQVTGLDPGTHVVYKVTVTSTGDAPVTNLKVWDNLPGHVQLVPNTLTRDGSNTTQTSEKNFFGNGITLDHLAPGDSVVFKFEAIVGPNDTASKCSTNLYNNTGLMVATGLPQKESQAGVSEQCKPPKPQPPVYSCDELQKPFQNNRYTYTFTANATAKNGAVITKYVFNFGDGTPAKTIVTNAHTAKVAHNFPSNLSTNKTYTTKVTVWVSVNGKAAKPVTANACQKSITVKAQPKAECINLAVSQTDRTVNVHAVISPKTAKINQVTYDFGDNTGTVMRNNLNDVVTHTYGSDVTQATITALVTFSSPQGVPASTCAAQVSFVTPPGQTPPSNLVNTGPGSVAALFAAVSVIGAVAHRIFLTRRFN